MFSAVSSVWTVPRHITADRVRRRRKSGRVSCCCKPAV